MFKVELQKRFLHEVVNFTDSFHHKNMELIIGSGLDDENIIIESYRVLAKNLRTMIFFRVRKYFSQEIIAKNIGNEKTYAILQIHTLRVFVYFTEDSEKQVRYIESIEFFRK